MALHVQLMALGIIAAQLLELRVDGGPPYFSHGEAVGNNATAKCWQKKHLSQLTKNYILVLLYLVPHENPVSWSIVKRFEGQMCAHHF